MSSQLIVATKADLPLTYRHACMAIAECVRIDECKGWMDKSAAIAAYAKMSKNPELEVDAKRIRLRATRRLGELLGKNVKPGGRPGFSSKLGNSGLSPEEKAITVYARGIARGIARVPEAIFESEIKKSHPPSPFTLSVLGAKNPAATLKVRKYHEEKNNEKRIDRKRRERAKIIRDHLLLEFIINGKTVRDLDWAEVTEWAQKQMHRCRALLMLSEGKNPSLRVGDCVDEAMADEAMRLTENS